MAGAGFFSFLQFINTFQNNHLTNKRMNLKRKNSKEISKWSSFLQSSTVAWLLWLARLKSDACITPNDYIIMQPICIISKVPESYTGYKQVTYPYSLQLTAFWRTTKCIWTNELITMIIYVHYGAIQTCRLCLSQSMLLNKTGENCPVWPQCY